MLCSSQKETNHWRDFHRFPQTRKNTGQMCAMCYVASHLSLLIVKKPPWWTEWCSLYRAEEGYAARRESPLDLAQSEWLPLCLSSDWSQMMRGNLVRNFQKTVPAEMKCKCVILLVFKLVITGSRSCVWCSYSLEAEFHSPLGHCGGCNVGLCRGDSRTEPWCTYSPHAALLPSGIWEHFA